MGALPVPFRNGPLLQSIAFDKPAKISLRRLPPAGSPVNRSLETENIGYRKKGEDFP